MTELEGWFAPWKADAACRGEDDLFFPVSEVGPSEKEIARAKAFCRGCPVREECRAEARKVDVAWDPWGVWGGLTATERVAEIREARQ